METIERYNDRTRQKTTSLWIQGKLEWKRLQNNQECIVDMEMIEEPTPF